MPLLVLDGDIPGLGDGSTSLYLFGSGLAFPSGLESPLEYNGLTFNTIHTLDKIRVRGIDGLADADIRDQRDVNPSSHGETPGQAFYGGRTLTISGRIEAGSLNKMRDMQQALRAAFEDLIERPLIFRVGSKVIDLGDGPVTFLRDAQINCRKIQPMAWTEEQVDLRFFRNFMVTLRASDPRFTSYVVAIAQRHFTGLTIADAEIISDSIFNLGNFASQPTIDLIGPMTTPTLTNLVTGQIIKLNAAIASGRRWTIDVAAKTVEDQDGASQFRYLTVDSDLWELQPGVNIVQFDAPSIGDGSGVVIKYRHAWM